MAQHNLSRIVSLEQLLWGFVILPLLLFVWILFSYQATGQSWSLDWVPSLGITLAIRLDGLSFLFATLITGIGAFIQFYALAYMKKAVGRVSFHLYLTLFMVAMLGLVLSDNILLMFVFWELTTLTSYLLIGFNHEQAQSRRNALHSLLVTGAGGLALLAGLIMIGEMSGTYRFSELTEMASALPAHPWFTVSLLLVLLGAFTKSAQFPFHFWLPGAMAAPTPVSAYLHSATMVKAGVYLLARVSPIYNGSDIWCYSLIFVGGMTALWSALNAARQTDLKLILAHSTNSALGKLTLLLGIGSELAITAAVLFIMSHALYKAALFMVVGNIDKAKGTREIDALQGLASLMVITCVAALIAALSKAGFPPLFGFLSKEYMYKSGLEVWPALVIVLLLVNSIMVGLAIQVAYRPFLKGPLAPISFKQADAQPGLWLPPLLLALASMVMPLFMLGWLNANIVVPASIAINPQAVGEVAKLWQGVNLPLVLSGATLLLGYLVYRMMTESKVFHAFLNLKIPEASAVFQRLMELIISMANWLTELLQHKRLSGYLLTFFTVLLLMLVSVALPPPAVSWQLIAMVSFHEVGLAILMVITAICCATSTSKLVSVAALGVIGFLTTLLFSLYSAPDVAKTLLLVETLMVVFVALLMRYFPAIDRTLLHSGKRKALSLLVAFGIGAMVTLMLILITQKPIDLSVSQFFAEQSVAGGYGRNVVNVILVDFRAFDTLGEILVVVVAGIAAVALFTHQPNVVPMTESIIFRSTAHIVAALMLLFSVYLLLRGHNAPGGGFIGALIAVSGLALLIFAESSQFVRQRLYFQPFNIATFGIFLGLLAGMLGVFAGMPFLTGLWWGGGDAVGLSTDI